jgi:predicted ArsR family transcriptional regulator
MLTTKTQVRKALGRGRFTSVEVAEALGVQRATARLTLRKLVEAGLVEALPDTQKVLDADGEPQRGRPRQVYKVVQGK